MKKISIIIISCCILFLLLPACSDDSTTTTTSQSSGHQPTQIGTPNGVPVTSSIGETGGSIISVDSTFELVVPAGALSVNTDITIQPITNFCYNGEGNAFRLTPEGLTFSQPVTVKFHYSDTTLSGTLGMFMGIARQDGQGNWHYFNDITNDTVNRVISAEMTQLSAGDRNTGGGDMSFFDMVRIFPQGARLQVNGYLNLRVSILNTYEDDEIIPLVYNINNWWIVPNPGGGSIVNSHDQSALYQAPAQVPSTNPVTVGANINTQINYRGQVTGQSALTALVTIESGDRIFDLVINVTGDMSWLSQYNCTYTDGVNMVVSIHNGSPSTVSISTIINRFPNVTPSSGQFPNGQGSITWIPENIGLTDVTNVTGFVYGVNQDHFELSLTHTANLVMPKWHCIPPQGAPYDVGGGPGFPVPTSLTFLNTDSTQTYSINNGIVVSQITLTLRP